MESDKAAEAHAKVAAQAQAQHNAEARRRKQERERIEARARDWNQEEVRMLEKALLRYPQGTAKRWEQVGEVGWAFLAAVCRLGGLFL